MKQFHIILKIRFANVERTVRGTLKAKSYQQALRRAQDITALWAEKDGGNHCPIVRINISIRELKPKPAKRGS